MSAGPPARVLRPLGSGGSAGGPSTMDAPWIHRANGHPAAETRTPSPMRERPPLPPVTALVPTGSPHPAGRLPPAFAAALTVAVFLFFWISVTPFVDLRDPTAQTPSETAGLVNQVAGIALAALSAIGLARGAWRSCRLLATALFILPLAWVLVTVAGSIDVSLSARRYVLTVLIIVQVVNLLLMPRSSAQFGMFVALALTAVLAICYAGVLFKPEFATHSTEDVLEPMHAGDWRGSFIHKNAAGGAMALAVIVSIFVGRAFNCPAGLILGLASANFLLQTSSKTAIALLPVSLVLAEALLRIRSSPIRAALLLAVLALFGAFTVGSVISPAIRAVVAAVSSDPTFTNRDQIWNFALSEFHGRPLLGYGFEAFWRSQTVFYGASESFANTAANAHDGYLDLLVTTGIVGLALCLLAFVAQPLIDLGRCLDAQREPVTVAFFVRVWVFCLLYSFLESIFFNNTPGWFMLLTAIIGLRFSAHAPIVRSDGGAGTGLSGGAGSLADAADRTGRLSADSRRLDGARGPERLSIPEFGTVRHDNARVRPVDAARDGR